MLLRGRDRANFTLAKTFLPRADDVDLSRKPHPFFRAGARAPAAAFFAGFFDFA